MPRRVQAIPDSSRFPPQVCCLRAALLGALFLASACAPPGAGPTVLYDEAAWPFLRECITHFERHYPRIQIQSRSLPSLEIARRIGIESSSADLAILADDRLVRDLLGAAPSSEGFRLFGDEIVLALGRRFQFSSQQERSLWEEEWPSRILSDDLRLLWADPANDPSGYYLHLVLKLAEVHYRSTGLYRRFLVYQGRAEPLADAGEVLRALLNGEADLAFLYRSMAAQHQLQYVRLPAEVSLGRESMQRDYARVFYHPSGEPADGQPSEIQGSPLHYGLLRLSGEAGARTFMDFLLSAEAREIARRLEYAVAPVERLR